jgi:hypothetical protein
MSKRQQKPEYDKYQDAKKFWRGMGIVVLGIIIGIIFQAIQGGHHGD